MSEPTKFRKKPVVIEAVQWTGGEYQSLELFCGWNWGRADAKGIPWEGDDKEKVVVWNALESQWLRVPVGHWIIRGIKGELYSCDPKVFAATYDPVDL